MMPQDPDDSFVDQEAIKEVIENVTDALRAIGLTVIKDSVGMLVDPQTGNSLLNFSAQLRPSAARKAGEDKEAKEEFNIMMAKQHDAMIEDKAEKIRRALAGGLDESIFEDEAGEDKTCLHERKHPDGFCLDCGHGMEGHE
jgi:hypothetical protein